MLGSMRGLKQATGTSMSGLSREALLAHLLTTYDGDTAAGLFVEAMVSLSTELQKSQTETVAHIRGFCNNIRKIREIMN